MAHLAVRKMTTLDELTDRRVAIINHKLSYGVPKDTPKNIIESTSTGLRPDSVTNLDHGIQRACANAVAIEGMKNVVYRDKIVVVNSSLKTEPTVLVKGVKQIHWMYTNADSSGKDLSRVANFDRKLKNLKPVPCPLFENEHSLQKLVSSCTTHEQLNQLLSKDTPDYNRNYNAQQNILNTLQNHPSFINGMRKVSKGDSSVFMDGDVSQVESLLNINSNTRKRIRGSDWVMNDTIQHIPRAQLAEMMIRNEVRSVSGSVVIPDLLVANCGEVIDPMGLYRLTRLDNTTKKSLKRTFKNLDDQSYSDSHQIRAIKDRLNTISKSKKQYIMELLPNQKHSDCGATYEINQDCIEDYYKENLFIHAGIVFKIIRDFSSIGPFKFIRIIKMGPYFFSRANKIIESCTFTHGPLYDYIGIYDFATLFSTYQFNEDILKRRRTNYRVQLNEMIHEKDFMEAIPQCTTSRMFKIKLLKIRKKEK